MNHFRNLFKNKEVKNASWIIGGHIAQMVLSFVVSIFTTRFLGPSNFGILNYAQSYVTFFSAFCTLGIGSVIIKIFVDDPNNEGETIGTALLLRIIASILSAVMIVGIVSLVDKDESITIIVATLSSIALVFQIFDTFNYWFQSRYQSKVSSIATLIAYAIVSIYKITLLILGKSVVWFAFSNSVDYICIAFVLFIAYKKNNGPKLKFSIEKAKIIISQSYHYILSGMMISIYSQTDKFMLKQMMDDASVGFYSLATQINTMWTFVLGAVINSLTPTIINLYKNSKESYERKNKQLYAIVIYLSVFVALVFTLFGKTLICLVYGESYAPSAEPLKIVTWYVIFSYLGVARNAWIVCENKQKYLKYMHCGAAITNVIMNLLFIPKWGAIGAATASLITQILSTILLPMLIPEMRYNVKLMVEALVLKNVFGDNKKSK